MEMLGRGLLPRNPGRILTPPYSPREAYSSAISSPQAMTTHTHTHTVTTGQQHQVGVLALTPTPLVQCPEVEAKRLTVRGGPQKGGDIQQAAGRLPHTRSFLRHSLVRLCFHSLWKCENHRR